MYILSALALFEGMDSVTYAVRAYGSGDHRNARQPLPGEAYGACPGSYIHFSPIWREASGKCSYDPVLGRVGSGVVAPSSMAKGRG